ncbi:hypothetical protein [uncultured Paracoccus sp.]|uniref:hypothetical protein n=1 Tax=uncultured Paracoccus sp. TaxID=189685 RepID=UPI0025ED7946|nr:hypothetical protein [uncultured Paracoccus sp.]
MNTPKVNIPKAMPPEEGGKQLSYLADELKLELRRKIGGDLKKSSLGPEERQVLNFLGRRLRS